MRTLHLLNYQTALSKMQQFTQQRTQETPDEIWFCEHPPVFTLGRHAEQKHILDAHGIPIVSTDRGGQVTYHGPGQLMIYTLLDLRRKNWGVAKLVCQLENIIIDMLTSLNIKAERRKNMPGVYVNAAKIASIGLRIKAGCAYHGMAVNVNMDLTPFTYINPCGYEQLPVTQISAFVPEIQMSAVVNALMPKINANIPNAVQNAKILLGVKF